MGLPYAAPPMFPARMIAGCALCLTLLAAGCSPQIGDSCGSSTDCSINGDRICDFASPGGYCTVQGCDPDTCPGNSLCVEWRFNPPRTSESYCMDRCAANGGCRQGAGYACVHEGDAILEGPEGPLARITDLNPGARNKGFCASVAE